MFGFQCYTKSNIYLCCKYSSIIHVLYCELSKIFSFLFCAKSNIYDECMQCSKYYGDLRNLERNRSNQCISKLFMGFSCKELYSLFTLIAQVGGTFVLNRLPASNNFD